MRGRVVDEFKKIGRLAPYRNKRLLFAALIETFLRGIGEPVKDCAVDY